MRLNCIELIGVLSWRQTGATEDEFVFEYSTDNGESWQNWEQDSQIEGHDYQPVLIRGDNAGKARLGTDYEYDSPNVTFSTNGNLTQMYGNIAALYDYNLEADIPDACFMYLFNGYGELEHGPGFAKGENQNVGNSVLNYTYKNCWNLKQLDPILSEEAVNNSSYTFEDCSGVQTLRFGSEPWKDAGSPNQFYINNGFLDGCWSSGTIYHRECDIYGRPGNWTDVSRDDYEDYFKIVALTTCAVSIGDTDIRDDFEWSYNGVYWNKHLKSSGGFTFTINPEGPSTLMFRYDGRTRPFRAIGTYSPNGRVKMSGTFTSLYDSFDASIDQIYVPSEDTLLTNILGEVSLVVKPEISNAALDIYNQAFSGNPNLSSVEVIGITSWDQLGQHYGWLENASPTGVFKRPSNLPEPEQYGISTIPVGWSVLPPYGPFAGLKLTSQQDGSWVKLTKRGGPTTLNLEYSDDDGATWQAFDLDTEYVIDEGQAICLRAPAGSPNTSGTGQIYNHHQFEMTGQIAASGNIMSLYDCECATAAMTEYGLDSLFNGCTALVDASELELPATTLAAGCYSSMFNRCTSLTAAPELPATTLANDCYSSMFRNCTSLTAAPVISAVSGAERCCEQMFGDCTGLQTATVCFDGTGTGGLYAFFMFGGCTSLNEVFVPNLLEWKGDTTLVWLQNVAPEGTFHCDLRLGTNSSIQRGDSNCPYNWNVVNYEYDEHDLSSATMMFVSDSYEKVVLDGDLSALFTGSAIESRMDVKIGDTALTEGTDYEITYSGNIGTNGIDDVTDATATITGKGDYYGSNSKIFRIISNNIQSKWCEPFSYLNLHNYTGQPIENKVNMFAAFQGVRSSTTRNVNASYTYENNTDIGTATTIVSGVGNWSGTVEFQWKIVDMLPGALCFKKPVQTYTFFYTDIGNAKLAESYDNGQTWQAFDSNSWQGNKSTTRLIRADDENLTGKIRLYNPDTDQQLSVSGNPMRLRSVTREIEGDEQIGLLSNMFEEFKGLVDASELELPEEMGVSCCARMFKDCSRLITSPTIPGTNLSTDCMREMFIGCSQLSSVKYDGSSDNLGDTYTKDWLSGVANEGAFTYADASFDRFIERGPSTVPYNWLFEGGVIAFKNLYINDRIVKTLSINGNALLIGEIPPVRSLLDCTATIKQQRHTGEPLEPIPVVETLQTKVKLQNGTDFEVIGWRDNVDIGTGYATIQGIGDYTGVVDVPFEIIGIEYALSSGGDNKCYFITDYNTTSQTSLSTRIWLDDAQGNVFIGANDVNDSNDWRLFNFSGQLYYDVGNSRNSVSFSPYKDVWIDLSVTTDGKAYIDGNLTFSHSDTYTGGGPVLVFGKGSASSVTSEPTTTAMLKDLAIFENGQLQRHYVPTEMNGVVGLYDEVNDAFIAPTNGTGVLVEYDA